MLYKILQGLVDIPIGHFLNYNRYGAHFQTIHARTKYHECSFFPVLSLPGTNFPVTLFSHNIWQCSNRTEHCHHWSYYALGLLITVSLLLLSFTITNSFYLYLYLLLSSLTTLVSFLHSCTQPISILLDGKLKAYSVFSQIVNMMKNSTIKRLACAANS